MGLGAALMLFFSAPALGIPERARDINPLPLSYGETNVLTTSTVIKVLEVWPHSKLEIKITSPLDVELTPEGGRRSLTYKLTSHGLSVNQVGDKVQISVSGKSTTTPKISLAGLGMTVQGTNWPRRVDVHPGKDGKLWVIYHVNLENYVAKVLPHEMSLSWPEEALKAQAIAIRTYATYQMERNKNRPFHVHATTRDQVFRMEPVKGPWASKLSRVLSETKGQVLMDSAGRVASIHYHADCGGTVERTPWVWSGHLSPTAPIKCADHPHVNWKLAVKDEELLRKLSRIRKDVVAMGSVQGVEPLKNSPSGRVEELSILMDSGVALNMRPEELRRVLGPDHLKSARFTVRTLEDGVEFSGHGYGHGVGLCQRGSKAFAEQGRGSSEILKIYYPTLSIADGSPRLTAQRDLRTKQQ